MSLAASAQLSAGVRKYCAPLSARADRLQLDAADRADLAVVVDRAGAGHELAAGHAARGELVDDAEREHQAGARAADIGELDVDGEREEVLDAGLDADDRPRLGPVVGGLAGGDRHVLLRRAALAFLASASAERP